MNKKAVNVGTPGHIDHDASAGVSELEAMLERIEALRDKWADQAEAIERIYGGEEPASCAIRLCIGNLYDCIRADKF